MLMEYTLLCTFFSHPPYRFSKVWHQAILLLYAAIILSFWQIGACLREHFSLCKLPGGTQNCQGGILNEKSIVDYQ